ncbi:MAG: sulfite exporter TauE/SafE family protein, partial [Cyanobacteria bacterium P01_H01_bin.121]
NALPPLPLLNPMLQQRLHDRLSRAMAALSQRNTVLTPLLLGMAWGLLPCGFLYAAQIKAAETGSLWQGGLTMVAFGLGTLPTMVGVGWLATTQQGQRQSQLTQLAGSLTFAIGVLILLRTGDAMQDYSGHAALICLVLALIARPLHRVWPALLRYRRLLGVGACILAIAHILQMVEHSWNWNWQAVTFLIPQHRVGIVCGAIALMLMLPLALTSFDIWQKRLGRGWRQLHLLSVPALVLTGIHALLIGSRYFGSLQLTWLNWTLATLLGLVILAVLLVRWRWIWSRLALERWYVEPTK